MLALSLGACTEDPVFSGQSCAQVRAQFDAAFDKAANAGARKAWEEQSRHVTDSQKTYLAMETQGCCAKEGACPALNVQ